MTTPLLWGFFISVVIAFLFHLFALMNDIRMSGISMLLSVVMFMAITYHSANMVAGMMAKSIVYECTEVIEDYFQADLSTIGVDVSYPMIHELHPSLGHLLDYVEIRNPDNSSLWLDDIHSVLNHNLQKSAGWFLGFLILCGIPAFLMGHRTQNERESRRSRIPNSRTRRNRR